MNVFSLLNKIFLAVYIPAIAITVARILSSAKGKVGSAPTKNSEFVENMTTAQLLYYILPNILLIGVVLYFIIQHKCHWLLLLFTIPQILSILDTTYQSVEVVGSVVKSIDNQKLSTNETLSIQILALVFVMLSSNGIRDLLENKVQEISSIAARDGLMILLIFAFLFCYIFFIVSLLPIPISFLVSVIKKIPKAFIGQASKVVSFFVARIDGPYRNLPLLLFVVLPKYKKMNTWLRAIAYITIPFIVCADFLVSFGSFAVSLIFVSAGHLFLILKRIGRTVSHFAAWSNKIQSKRYTSISFRIGLVIALTGTVVLNRSYEILENFDSNSAILEFVASAILIPVIFEWINSAKRSKEGESKEL